jgi:superkiller protein 3
MGLLSGCSGTSDEGQAVVAPPVEIDLSAANPDAAAKLGELVERAVRTPEDATFRGELGMAYSVNGYQLAAMKSYEQAAELDPTNPRWSYLLALARAKSGDLEGALVAMRASLELDPSYVSSHLYLGQWLLDLGRAEEAEQALREALELDPVNRAGLLLLARAMFRQNRNPEVIEMLEGLTEERPGDAYLYHLLGTAYRFQGETRKANAALARGEPDAEAMRWEDPWSDEKLQFMAGYGADMLQAESMLTGGRTAEAIALFEALRMKRPDDLQMLNNLSVAYRRDGQEEKSLEVLEQGVEVHPEYFPFHMNLATAYERDGDLDRALEHLDRVIELNPSLGEAYRRKGQILIRQERLEEALEAYESALSYESGDATNYLYAGTIATELGQCDRAIRWLETATRMQPELVPALLALGECRARVGDFVGAEMALDRVAEIAPDLHGLATTRELVAELQSDQP